MCSPYGVNCSTSEGVTGWWNCTYYDNCGSVANNDISGIGVLIAFFTTSTLTFIVAWATYILDAGFVTPSPTTSPDGLRKFHPRVLDDHLLSWLHLKVLRRKNLPKLSSRWQNILQRCILAFSDAHLITGLAILVAAFSQARTITVYHFSGAVSLAWLSSTVHLVTLAICRPYFQARAGLLYWRLAAMTILWGMLLAALILTASPQAPSAWSENDNWDDPFFYDTPVVCTWSCGAMAPWILDVIIAVTLIVGGFVIRALKLVKPVADFCSVWLVEKPGYWTEDVFVRCALRSTASGSVWWPLWTFITWLVVCLYLHARAFYDIFDSLLSELTWLTLSLIWGANKAFTWRSGSPLNEFEDTWGFGQILPMFLLIAPLAAIPEMYYAGDGQDLTTANKRQRAAVSGPLIGMNPMSRQPRMRSNDNTSYGMMWKPNTAYAASELPILLRHRDAAYKSKAFRFLIFAYMVLGPIWLIMIMYYQRAVGAKNPANTVLKGFKDSVLPITLLLPTAAFLVLFAPFSPVIRGALKGDSYQSIDGTTTEPALWLGLRTRLREFRVMGRQR